LNSKGNAGFRKKNMPALLLRFFCDMKLVLENCHSVLKQGGNACIVLGDSTTVAQGKKQIIPTVDFISLLAEKIGFSKADEIEISVTTDNHKHIKNAITKNVVLCLQKGNE